MQRRHPLQGDGSPSFGWTEEPDCGHSGGLRHVGQCDLITQLRDMQWRRDGRQLCWCRSDAWRGGMRLQAELHVGSVLVETDVGSFSSHHTAQTLPPVYELVPPSLGMGHHLSPLQTFYALHPFLACLLIDNLTYICICSLTHIGLM